jgi:hypothetical protein
MGDLAFEKSTVGHSSSPVTIGFRIDGCGAYRYESGQVRTIHSTINERRLFRMRREKRKAAADAGSALKDSRPHRENIPRIRATT